MEILKLTHPIKDGSGKVLSELSYDPEEITSELYEAAAGRAQKGRGLDSVSILAVTDHAFKLCIGKAAVLAVNENLSWEDLDRCKGHDLMRLGVIGQNFTQGSGSSNHVYTMSTYPRNLGGCSTCLAK